MSPARKRPAAKRPGGQRRGLPAPPVATFAEVREALLARREIALLDVREEDPFAQEHPLWAANLPLSHLELQSFTRIPRQSTPIVVYGEWQGEDLAPLAARRLTALGYSDVRVLGGGLEGWRQAGGELFRDVNVPSKSFGELVEEVRHTPSLPAEEVQALLDARARGEADLVVLDARRVDEYQTMTLPGSTSVPGAELVLRARALAPNPTTRIVVHCAGRTRSIIGAQSLVNAGLPNPVAALRNGTIGWTLAGQKLELGADRRGTTPPSPAQLREAQRDARRVATAAGVTWIDARALEALGEPDRTLYRLDVRTPEEYAAGHLPGFANAPGGQLVQETDHTVPVRGARIVLADDDGVRAAMSASWLAQMGWEVRVLEPQPAERFSVKGPAPRQVPGAPDVPLVSPGELTLWRKASPDGTAVLDVGPGVAYLKGHVDGAWYAIRAQLAAAIDTVLKKKPRTTRWVLTSGDGELARYAARDAHALLGETAEVYALEGGTAAWREAGGAMASGESRLAVPRTDRYRRPYEGTDAPREAMQAYLDWEFGLTRQLARDGTHHFKVI